MYYSFSYLNSYTVVRLMIFLSTVTFWLNLNISRLAQIFEAIDEKNDLKNDMSTENSYDNPDIDDENYGLVVNDDNKAINTVTFRKRKNLK